MNWEKQLDMLHAHGKRVPAVYPTGKEIELWLEQNENLDVGKQR
jgi:hypothetical protein